MYSNKVTFYRPSNKLVKNKSLNVDFSLNPKLNDEPITLPYIISKKIIKSNKNQFLFVKFIINLYYSFLGIYEFHIVNQCIKKFFNIFFII